jgi:hypothetical protein
MAAADLLVNLIANDKSLSKTMAKAGDSATRSASKFKRFATVAGGALAGIGLGAFLADSIKTYAGAEAQQVKLESAYKRFPKLADTNIESLRGLNKEIQRKTKFDDDDLAAMQSRLAAFDLTGQQIKTLTPIVADYAQVSGKDLETSAVSVGKAMMGNTRALKELGINYKLTGDKAKDAANIQALIEEKTKGAAEAFGQTAQGKLDIFNNQVGDLKEAIGEGLVPALTGLVEAVTPVVQWFGQLEPSTRTAIIGIAAVSAAALALAGPLSSVTSLVGSAASAFKGLGSAGSAAATGTQAASTGAGGGAAAMVALGVAATAAGAYLGTQMADAAGTAGAALAAVAVPGGALGLLFQKLTGDSQHLEDGMRAVAQSLGDMAAGGNIEGITQKWALMSAEMSPDELLRVADSIPGFNAALESAGMRVDAVSGKITNLPPAQLDAQIAPLQAKLTLAKAQLNSLKQQKKPDVDAINKAKATVATIQGQINGLKQKKQPTVDVNGAPAKQTLAGIGGQLGALKDKTVTVTVKRAGIGGSIGAATGGARSGMAIVGERGPELVALPEGSQVYTHSQSLRMMATGHYAKGKKLTAKQKAKQQAKAKAKADREAAYAAEKAAAQDQINELRGTGPGRPSLVDIANERQGYIDKITGSVSSFVGIGNYDVGARADALAEASSAQAEVNNSAVGSSARQSAMARLRAAQDKVASTPASVGAWLRQRVDKVRRWKDVLGRLGGVWGSTPAGQQLLQEIFDKGPDGGTELGEELLRNPGELQELMQLQGEAGMLGYQAAMGNPAVIDATNRYTRQAQVVEQLQTVVLQLNGKVLHEALLQIKRSAGGQALGLA